MIVRVFREKNDLRLARKSLNVRRVREAPGTHVAANHVGQVLLMERNLALRHFHHARAVFVAAGDGRPEIRKASGDDRTQIAGAVDSDLHSNHPPRTTETLTGNVERRASKFYLALNLAPAQCGERSCTLVREDAESLIASWVRANRRFAEVLAQHQ